MSADAEAAGLTTESAETAMTIPSIASSEDTLEYDSVFTDGSPMTLAVVQGD